MKKIITFMIAVTILSGCVSVDEFEALSNEFVSLQERHLVLEEQNDSLESRVTEMEEKLSSLTVEFYTDQIDKKFFDNDAAYLSFYEKGYGITKSDVGSILLAIDEVEPYLDGCKVRMRIGNPHFVTFSGIELKISVDLDGLEDEPYLVNIADEIKSGSWTSVEFNIANINPEKYESIYVEVITNSLQLY